MNNKVYLDNAATTPLRKEVIDEMMEVLSFNYGNPSSTHSHGRAAKNILETSRKKIATFLDANASEIIFTSSATEGANFILRNAIINMGVKIFITSRIEHHAVLHTLNALKEEFDIQIRYVDLENDGSINYSSLDILSKNDEKSLVALMHVNNETGEILDIDRVASICKKNGNLFFCDMVQSIGKLEVSLQKMNVDFAIGSAHKFHGPKGVGFVFFKKDNYLSPMIHGGEQEKGLRAGTEGIHQAVGLVKALEISQESINENINYIKELKGYCIDQLISNFPDCIIIGKNTIHTILNVVLPFDKSKSAMLLFSLDMKGISVSRGSACQSGSGRPSHVLAAFLTEENQLRPNLRISFSYLNTKEEIDKLIEALMCI